jgi:predicted nucleic acid-binding Zn ribbon protein
MRNGRGDANDREWLTEAERRAPRPVGDALDSLARRLGAPTAASLNGVFSGWPDAVGPQIAAHTRPVGLTDGVLTVAVDDPAWATQLRYLANDLLAKVAAVAGDGVVGRIEWRVEAPRRGS